MRFVQRSDSEYERLTGQLEGTMRLECDNV